jgi:hypothetical protein
MALVKEKEFKRPSGDKIDPFHLKCEITVMRNHTGGTHMIRAAVNTGQFDKSGKTTKPLSVEHWDFTESMMNDPKGKTAVQAYKRLMADARIWLQKEINIYKYPSH